MKNTKSKKLLSLLLAALMVLGLMPMTFGSAFAYEKTQLVTEGALTFEIYPESGYAVVAGCDEDLAEDNIVIPDTVNGYPVTEIWSNGLFGEGKYTTITIPASVTTIEGNILNTDAFNVRNIKVNENNKTFCDIDGVLFNKVDSILLSYPNGRSDKTYTVPDGTKEIAEAAFACSFGLESIVFPDTLKRVEKNAFFGCINLKSIPISKLEYAGPMSFAMTGIESLVVPKGLKFSESEDEDEQGGAFSHNLKLTSITIEEGVERLCYGEFMYSHVESITIPKSVKQIDDLVLAFCPYLKEVILEEGNENYVTVDGILYDKDMTKIVTYPEASPLTVYKVPETVGFVEYLFAKNLKTVIVPKNVSVRETSRKTFGYYVEAYEVNSYQDLLELDIKQEHAEKEIEDFTIWSYTGSSAETYYNTYKDQHDLTFNPLDTYTGHIYSDWKVTTEPTYEDCGWKEHTCLLCGNKQTEFIPCLEAKEVIEGDLTFAIYEDLGYASVIGCADDVVVRSVVVPETINGYTVTTIENGAFAGCKWLDDVTFPKTITKIEDGISYDNRDLAAFYMPEENEYYYTIDGVLFEKATNKLICYPMGNTRQKYTVPDGTKTIGKYSFMFAFFLEEVVMPDSVTTIEEESFIYTFDLKKVTFGKNLSKIGEAAFFFSNIESVTIPDTVKEIPEGAFAYDPELKSVTIEEGVESIGECAFGFSGIDSIVIPKSVKTIDEGAFNYTRNLKAIELAEGNDNFTVIDGVLYDKNVTTIISYPQGSEMTVYKVPDTIKYLDAIWAQNLKTLIVPKDTEIDDFEYSFGHYIGRFVLNTDTYMSVGDLTRWNYIKEVSGFTLYGYKGSSAENFYDINHGNNDVSFVALDDFTGHVYSDWKVTKEPTVFAEGEKMRTCLLCGDVQTEKVDKLERKEATDAESGIGLVYSDGSFDGDVSLEVSEIFGGSVYNVFANKKGDKLGKLYDITPYVGGQAVQPNGSVWVKIALPAGYDANSTNAYYVAADGTFEKLNSFIEDGYIYFEATHFSFYAIVDENSKAEAEPTPTNCDCMCHKTGFAGFIYKIMKVFWKLFRINKTCDCGVAHY